VTNFERLVKLNVESHFHLTLLHKALKEMLNNKNAKVILEFQVFFHTNEILCDTNVRLSFVDAT
jgi:hypothetical protein